MIMDRSNYKNNLTLLCEEASDSVLSDFIVVFVNGFDLFADVTSGKTAPRSSL